MHAINDAHRRVVVTGIGVVSPIGSTKDAFWEALRAGRSGISSLNSLPQSRFPQACAGEVREFEGRITDFGELDAATKKALRKALKVMNRETQMAVSAAQQALNDSKISADGYDPERIGVSFGAGYVSMLPQDFLAGIDACTNERDTFDFQRWGTDGIPQVAPLWLLKCLPNMPACYIAIYNDLRGPNNTVTQGAAAANIAVEEAYHLVADGAADAILSGGTGDNILPYSYLHTVLEEEVSPGGPNPATICRPFDIGRTGSVVAEGAAAFLLEERNSAIARGATIYGEIVGAGSSCVVDRNHVPQLGQALANAIRAALNAAQLSPDEVGHVHAHGLSTQHADIEEAHAIRRIFGDRADTLPIVAAKSFIGNAGAGAGAMELAASLLALEQKHLFPTLNFEAPDPNCPIAPVVSSDVEAGESFLNVNMAPQGQASCVVVRAAA
jgi:3-oxoacyl-[acyl-carrier-protein] synthase II